jgi:hypothetical protein
MPGSGDRRKRALLRAARRRAAQHAENSMSVTPCNSHREPTAQIDAYDDDGEYGGEFTPPAPYAAVWWAVGRSGHRGEQTGHLFARWSYHQGRAEAHAANEEHPNAVTVDLATCARKAAERAYQRNNDLSDAQIVAARPSRERVEQEPPEPCSVEGCSKPSKGRGKRSKGRGWCGMHRTRFYSHGDVHYGDTNGAQQTAEGQEHPKETQ